MTNYLRYPLRKILLIGTALLGLLVSLPSRADVVADHNAVRAFAAIPAAEIIKAKANVRLYYSHTSHGRQITNGLVALQSWHNARGSSLFNYNLDGRVIAGSLSIADKNADLYNPGSNPRHPGDTQSTAWFYTTKDALDSPTNDRKISMWTWCAGEINLYTADQLNSDYLAKMSELEAGYPTVTFVYVTAPINGTGVNGVVNQRNEQIRQFYRNNPHTNKALYDFADIESYDPTGPDSYMPYCLDGDYCTYNSAAYAAKTPPASCGSTRDANWATLWWAAHPAEREGYPCAYYENDGNAATSCSACQSDSHTNPLNCDIKVRAFWWLMARLGGWNGGADQLAPAAPRNLRLL